jgi:hypothetical protein
MLAHEGGTGLARREGEGGQGALSACPLRKPRCMPSQFSVDDFENAGTTPWQGVRNHQAKNYMKSMQVGDKVGFGSVALYWASRRM